MVSWKTGLNVLLSKCISERTYVLFFQDTGDKVLITPGEVLCFCNLENLVRIHKLTITLRYKATQGDLFLISAPFFMLIFYYQPEGNFIPICKKKKKN